MIYRITLPILLILFLNLISLEAAPKQTICLNMIVKNESEVICKCLESVKDLIDYWVIVDTGSSDGTQEKIRNFLRDIPGELHERPWVNFGHNRNEALSLTKGKSDYVLIMDADDFLVFSPEFFLPYLDKDCYNIRIDDISNQYFRIQLIKSILDWRWEGVLHEHLALDYISSYTTLEHVTYTRTGNGARSKDPLKYQKDAQILEEALKTDPYNTRYVFYLAQSYLCAGNHMKAIENYQKRIELQGWQEEVFYSYLQIAILKDQLGLPENIVVDGYYKAYMYRPTRAEPLYYLTNYYRRKGDFVSGYYTALQALNIPFSKDILFVEQWIYHYALLFEYSICAYWVGEYEKAKEACFTLLENPNLPAEYRSSVEWNLAWIESYLASIR